MKGKFISLFLALTMVFTSVNIPVFAEDIAAETENPPVTEVTEATPEPSASPTALELPMLKNPVKLPVTIPSPTAEKDNIKTTASPQPTYKAPTVTAEPSLDLKTIPLRANTFKPMALMADGDITDDLQSGTVEIAEGGEYTVTNANGDITNNIVVKTGVTATLTLTDVTMTSSTTAPIKVEEGAELTLVLEGNNSITASTAKYAGIAVYSSADRSSYGTLIIEGNGSLEVGSKSNAPAIGTNRNGTDASSGAHGQITIKSGNITAKSGAGGAGIGAPYGASAERNYYGVGILIEGGNITATGGQNGAGIGGGYYTPNAPITITGGNITAAGGKKSGGTCVGIGIGRVAPTEFNDVIVKGGSIKNTTFDDGYPVNEFGEPLHCAVMQMPSDADYANKEVTVDSWKAYTDADGKLYPYISDDTNSFALNYGEDIYSVSEITPEVTEYTLTKYSAEEECKCDDRNAKVSLDGIPSEIKVNIIDGTARQKVDAVFIPAEGCTYPVHSLSKEYSIKIDGAEADADEAKIEGGFLVVSLAAADKTITLTATVKLTKSGGTQYTYTATKDITITKDSTANFDISDGDIDISPDTSVTDNMKITVGASSYSIPKTETIHLVQSDSVTRSKITVTGVDPRIELDNVSLSVLQGSALNLRDNVDVTLVLKGSNKIKSGATSAISGITSAATQSTITIEGDGDIEFTSHEGAGISKVGTVTVNSGTVTATSDNGAGIGNVNSLIINGGTVYATGTNGGSGIGGSAAEQVSNMTVTINGGKVYATGSGSSAGIGISSNTSSGGMNIEINGGFVSAKGGENGGVGIDRGASNRSAKVTINGGSVKADFKNYNSDPPISAASTNLRPVTVTVEGITGAEDVEYSIDGDEEPATKIRTSTDEDGKLYLYLVPGMRWIRVYKDGNTYYYYTRIQVNADNTAECIPNPETKLISFTVPGQTKDTVINEADHTVTVYVPKNIKLELIEPTSEYTGATATEGRLDFSGAGHTAEYTITGHDKKEVTYTITLVLEDIGEINPTTYDISKGDIVISDEYVLYGGTAYNPDTGGYKIVGSTDTHILSTQTEKNAEGTVLPPITLDNVTIDTNHSGASVQINWDTEFTVVGKCSITSQTANAISVSGTYMTFKELSFVVKKGDENAVLNVESNASNAINIANRTSMTVTGMPIRIVSPDGTNALNGEGSFITDGIDYARIDGTYSSSGSSVCPKTADGTALYQLTARIASDNKDLHECVYKSGEDDEAKTYYIYDDATLYLLVPDGQYNISVTYDDKEYNGTIKINGAGGAVDLRALSVDNILYDSLTYKGGELKITVLGTILPDRVKLVLVPDMEGYDTLTADIIVEEDNSYSATFAFPENKSYDTPINYSVYYQIQGSEKVDVGRTVYLPYNNTVAQITAFEIQGQIRSEIYNHENRNSTIYVYMPWDHDYITWYNADITFIGSSIDPSVGMASFHESNGVMRTNYTVRAKDERTTTVYEVYIYKEAAPTVTSFTFTNPNTSEGGTVRVTITGSALDRLDHAEHAENKDIWIYSEDGAIAPVKAVYDSESGRYVADIAAPANDDDNAVAEYTIKARIGTDYVQAYTQTLRVPRKPKSGTKILSFTLPNQVGESVITDGEVRITMPYDADLSALEPQITVSDNARYSPFEAQDFNSEVIYTVTAENGDTHEYYVYVTKQAAPVITSLEFDDPQYSSAGQVDVIVRGENLENAANSVRGSYMTVSALLQSGSAVNADVLPATVRKNEETGDFVATLTVPSNPSTEERVYLLSAKIGNEEQSLDREYKLTVPSREDNAAYMTGIIISPEQGEPRITETDGKIVIEVAVPYNTDLRNVEPTVYYSGENYTPTGAQNFNNDVEYTVYALDGTSNTYTVHVRRIGVPRIDVFSAKKPEYYSDTNITVNIEGRFIPSLLGDGTPTDTLEIEAIPRGGSEADAIKGTVDYGDNYAGKATGHLTLPINESTETNQIYDLKIYLNGTERQIAETLTVPRRKTRKITSFGVPGAANTQIIEDEVNGNRILISMPYNSDLTHIFPSVQYDGDSYTPTDIVDLDKKEVVYTVSAMGDEDRTYTASAERIGTPIIHSVELANTPTSYKASQVDVEIDGVFFYSARVVAVPVGGGDSVEADAVLKEGGGVATLNIPENDSDTDKEYEIEIYLDGFTEPIEYTHKAVITVPRRKTKAISHFMLDKGQVQAAEITNTDIYIKVYYDTDLTEITPTLQYDGDRHEPEGTVNFNNPTKSLVYTIYADNDDEGREYTVHITRDGQPQITNISYISPTNFLGGNVLIKIEGIFFDSAVLEVISDSGESLAVERQSFSTGKAEWSVLVPRNDSTTAARSYRMRFTLDGTVIEGSEITVPRRTTRAITEFTLPDVQEGETEINGTDINITVPYTQDITAVTPQITYDADTITPSADAPQDFTNPVTYTLSSSGDESVTYTVHVTKKGEDPYIKSMTVENQDGDTVYDGDNISIVLPSSADLKAVEPILDYVGTDYSPKGAQDFTNSSETPVVYTVVNEYGVEHKYYVTVTQKKKRSGGGSSSSSSASTPTPEPTPQTTPEPTTPPEQTIEPTPTPVPDTSFTPIPDNGAAYISGYGDSDLSEFRPDNTITRAEISKILAVLDSSFDENTVYPNVFPDMNADAWYTNYINFAVSKGYISGYEDGSVRPENMITRAEFAAILARFAGIDTVETDDVFIDTAQFEWCRDEINTLALMGVISGYGDGTFLPENRVTRAETVSMINRILGRKMTDETAALTCPFSDVDASHWAYNDILIASCEY